MSHGTNRTCGIGFAILVAALGSSQAATPTTLGVGGSADPRDWVIPRDAAQEVLVTSLDGFSVSVYMPWANVGGAKPAVQRVLEGYVQRLSVSPLTPIGASASVLGAPGVSSHTEDSMTRALLAEPWFVDHPVAARVLVQRLPHVDGLRLVQGLFVGVGERDGQVESSPRELAADAKQVLMRWRQVLETQLAWMFEGTTFDRWFEEAAFYTEMSGDESLLLQTQWFGPDEFDTCLSKHGPKSGEPDRPRCQDCCTAAGSICDYSCEVTTLKIATAGCIAAGGGCALTGVAAPVAWACCTAFGGIAAAGYHRICTASCARRRDGCRYHC